MSKIFEVIMHVAWPRRRIKSLHPIAKSASLFQDCYSGRTDYNHHDPNPLQFFVLSAVSAAQNCRPPKQTQILDDIAFALGCAPKAVDFLVDDRVAVDDQSFMMPATGWRDQNGLDA